MDLFADGRFEIHRARILGSGAFGIVFPGYDHVTQQEVAIKEIDLEAIRLDASLSPEQKERSLASVEKEMAICLHLKHPHIVECIYVNVCFFFVFVRCVCFLTSAAIPIETRSSYLHSNGVDSWPIIVHVPRRAASPACTLPQIFLRVVYVIPP